MLAGEKVLYQLALDQTQAVAGLKAFEKATASANTEMARLGKGPTGLAGTQKAFRNFGYASQQVGYQVSDFVVQVQGGQNAFKAFTQQSLQLTGLFMGPFGLALTGAAIAFGLFGESILKSLNTTMDFTVELGDLTDVMTRYDKAVANAEKTGVDLATQFGNNAAAAEKFYDQLLLIEKIELVRAKSQARTVVRPFEALAEIDPATLRAVTESVDALGKLTSGKGNLQSAEGQKLMEQYPALLNIMQQISDQYNIQSDKAAELGLMWQKLGEDGKVTTDEVAEFSQKLADAVIESGAVDENSLALLKNFIEANIVIGEMEGNLNGSAAESERIAAAARSTADSWKNIREHHNKVMNTVQGFAPDDPRSGNLRIPGTSYVWDTPDATPEGYRSMDSQTRGARVDTYGTGSPVDVITGFGTSRGSGSSGSGSGSSGPTPEDTARVRAEEALLRSYEQTAQQLLDGATGDLFDLFEKQLIDGKTTWEDWATVALRSIEKVAHGLLDLAFAEATAAAAGGTTGGKGLFATLGKALLGSFTKAGTGMIASGPTPAIIGEAGPEAVVPLTRGANGDLGLAGGGSVVNIHNYSGQPVRTEEGAGGQIEVIIGEVTRQINKGGSISRAMEQSYGVKRGGNR